MKKYILSLISLGFLSCVSDNDFSTPDVCRGDQCKTAAELSKAPIPFKETFDNDFALWQVANTKGERKWYLTQHDGKPFATMSAFDGQNQPGVSIESWLISPLFNFDAQENETLEFKLADYYSNDNPLKVFYSTDYDGKNIEKATWRELTPPNTLFNNPKKADYNFESSGDIDLSGISGKAFIAFVYDSNGGKITSTAQLSEVHITAGKKEESTQETSEEKKSLDTPGEESASDNLAFVGGDFETEMNLNKYGLKSYANYESGAGIKDSKALHIETSGTSGNDYIFTTLASDNFPTSYTRLTFKLKGTAANKSISINLYKIGGSQYYKFNLGDVSADKTITSSSSNNYAGSINASDWVTITLDLLGISDLNTDSSNNFFALKIGTGSAFNILLDDFYIE